MDWLTAGVKSNLTHKSFIFSWIFMLIVIVFFLVGGLLTRYGCQAFLPSDQNITGLVYAAKRIDASFDFNDKTIKIDLNTAIL